MGEFYSVKVLKLHTFGDHLELVFCFAIYLMILMVGGEIGDGFSLATFGIIWSHCDQRNFVATCGQWAIGR